MIKLWLLPASTFQLEWLTKIIIEFHKIFDNNDTLSIYPCCYHFSPFMITLRLTWKIMCLIRYYVTKQLSYNNPLRRSSYCIVSWNKPLTYFYKQKYFGIVPIVLVVFITTRPISMFVQNTTKSEFKKIRYNSLSFFELN